MNREKAEFNILKKIEEERMKRNWSEYTLAKNSNLTQSTISTWYRRDLQPSVASIEKICSGLGITLSQFFAENRDTPEGTAEQQELISFMALFEFRTAYLCDSVLLKSFLKVS